MEEVIIPNAFHELLFSRIRMQVELYKYNQIIYEEKKERLIKGSKGEREREEDREEKREGGTKEERRVDTREHILARSTSIRV